MRAVLWFFVGLLSAAVCPAAAQPRALLVEETFLSVSIDGKDYRLETLLAKEAGAGGRLPVALIAHGQAADTEQRERLNVRSYLAIARDFARRGWLAAVVVRRGFGRSGGSAPYVLPQCKDGDYTTPLAAQTDDLEAALKAIARRSDADISTVLALGVSLGGAAVLNLAARKPEGLKAAVSISGGIRTLPKKDGPPPTCKPEDLIPVFAGMGERSRTPTLWLYAENDSFFPADYVRTLHEIYVAKGGRAEFHMFEPIGEDGHLIALRFEGMLRWLPRLDRFLRDNKLRTYDPAPLQAAVQGLNLSSNARQVANRYDGRPTEKALAVSQSGSTARSQFGGSDMAAMESKAREECEKLAKEPCRIVLRNFEVVPGDQRSDRPPDAAPPSPTTTNGAQ